MDPVLRRAGAAGGLDPATAMKFDAALCELDEASSAAPDTPLPQEQLLQLQHILRASCERGRDAAPFRSAFAAAGVRGLLIGFLSPTLPHQGGHRRQQIARTPGMLQALCGCIRRWPDDPIIADAAATAIELMMTCHELRPVALQTPHLVDSLCAAAARSKGSSRGFSVALAPLWGLIAAGGPPVALRAVSEPGLVRAAARAAVSADGGHLREPAHARALGFLSEALRQLLLPGAAGGEGAYLRAAATPGVADAAARNVAHETSLHMLMPATKLLSILLEHHGSRAAAARAALDAGAAPALLRLTAHARDDVRMWAAHCVAILANVGPARADLLLRPAALPALAAAIRRPGAGAPPDGCAAFAMEAAANLVAADPAAAAAFLAIALPGGVLPAFARHLDDPQDVVSIFAARTLAALTEAAAAAGPARLAATAAAPGLVAAVGAGLARVVQHGEGAVVSPSARPEERPSRAEAVLIVSETAGHLAESLDRLTSTGPAAVAALGGVEGLEAALAEFAGAPWTLDEDAAAAARVLR
ncbi:hypothetical protein MNEG_1724 [Monoraphidium neglectum]|uniref:Uncharacterized protein n=1 Tax=Monoraphidium neglectum TaxID=145388 RepID=A0A0D2NP90_9CHLO|nr:hypothetical protein MNEG_1724 [Monoraphidium neglectum]KIZ06231.1 hypothetical protein MNEG_1724 [Monoraphidium neglectum]|eukprot:XP_013905250.1 hypothetical protein MNEG_1724 [Monoraphidium neglectum]